MAIEKPKAELTEDDRTRVSEAIDKRRREIAALEWELIHDCVAVRQAEDALRKALDKVLERLGADDYQTVSNLGYKDVSSEFIFLQRTMGGLQMNALKQSSLISEIAGDACLRYELVEPQVKAAFVEARKKPISDMNNED